MEFNFLAFYPFKGNFSLRMFFWDETFVLCLMEGWKTENKGRKPFFFGLWFGWWWNKETTAKGRGRRCDFDIVLLNPFYILEHLEGIIVFYIYELLLSLAKEHPIIRTLILMMEILRTTEKEMKKIKQKMDDISQCQPKRALIINR